MTVYCSRETTAVVAREEISREQKLREKQSRKEYSLSHVGAGVRYVTATNNHLSSLNRAKCMEQNSGREGYKRTEMSLNERGRFQYLYFIHTWLPSNFVQNRAV